jgi:hypothetical protein
MKCFFIPVIIGTFGIVTKGLKISGSNARKACNRYSTENSCTRKFAYNKQSAIV